MALRYRWGAFTLSALAFALIACLLDSSCLLPHFRGAVEGTVWEETGHSEKLQPNQVCLPMWQVRMNHYNPRLQQMAAHYKSLQENAPLAEWEGSLACNLAKKAVWERHGARIWFRRMCSSILHLFLFRVLDLKQYEGRTVPSLAAAMNQERTNAGKPLRDYEACSAVISSQTKMNAEAAQMDEERKSKGITFASETLEYYFKLSPEFVFYMALLDVAAIAMLHMISKCGRRFCYFLFAVIVLVIAKVLHKPMQDLDFSGDGLLVDMDQALKPFFDSWKTPDMQTEATAQRFLVNKTNFPSAMCLDGSPASFYLRHAPPASANASKWILILEAGGPCMLFPPRSNSAHCHVRSRTQLGSTKFDSDTMELSNMGRIFSRDPSIAPTWHDWNTVFLRYCDGMRWVVSLPDPVRVDAASKADFDGMPLYLRGPDNLDAIVKTLMTSHGMDTATEVLLYGCSASGIGATVNADRVHALLAKSVLFTTLVQGVMHVNWDEELFISPELRSSPDAVQEFAAKASPYVSIDFQNKQYLGILYPAGSPNFMLPPAVLWHQLSLEPAETCSLDCIDFFVANRSIHRRIAHAACSQSFYAMPFVKAPIYFDVSKFDAMWIQDAVNLDQGPSAEATWAVNEWGLQMAGVWRSKFEHHSQLHPNTPMGVTLNGCVHHCDFWGLAQVEGKTSSQHFDQWYAAVQQWRQQGSMANAPRKLTISGAAFPCRDCCPYDKSVEHWKATSSLRRIIR